VGQHSSASGSALLGLDGFQLVSAELVDGEWQLAVQTTATVIGCAGCGVPAKPHGRRTVWVRDLPIGGRPVVLAWRKRLWRCHEPACGVWTWTERAPAIGPRAVLTERARAEACRRVGKDAYAVAAVARDLGVGWAIIMRAVGDHGHPLVEDPTRLDGVATLGLDETSFLKATRVRPTRWVTGLVDLEGGRLLDVVADRSRAAVVELDLAALEADIGRYLADLPVAEGVAAKLRRLLYGFLAREVLPLADRAAAMGVDPSPP
jgi:transposase